MKPVPITNLVLTVDHQIRPPSHETLQKITNRVDEGASVLYKVHRETFSENAVTQDI